MTYRLEKDFAFEAAHQLSLHDGKCARLHGHSFKGTIACEGDEIFLAGPKSGMLLDYGDMSAAVKEIVEAKLDHYFLNETLPVVQTTSEQIAKWFYDELKPRLPLLAEVTIEETCTSRCRYRP